MEALLMAAGRRHAQEKEGEELLSALMGKLAVGVQDSILEDIGFQTVKDTDLPSKLEGVSPQGGTALWDAAILGTSTNFRLKIELDKLSNNMTGSKNRWTFVNIILTDGDDNSSKNSLEETKKVFAMLGLASRMGVDFKTILIGVGLSANGQKNLKELESVAPQNIDVHTIGSGEIEHIFNKISVSLGLQKQVRMSELDLGIAKIGSISVQDQHVLKISQNHFAVTFTLDISGSMAGGKWNRVKRATKEFMAQLGGGDYVMGITFNNSVQKLSKDDEDD